MKIGMFDSGIGGITVLKEFYTKYPNNVYIYYGDTLNIPYGEKTKEQLLELATKIIKYLERKNVDMIIIACGTVSSNIYKELKSITTIPLYNAIDTSIEYVLKKKYKTILVMATNATINSHIFKNKLENINVIEVACPKLVPLIESNNEIKLKKAVKEYLDPYIKYDIDAIILGCTHYSLIESYVKELLSVDIINMGKILAASIDLPNNDSSGIELFFSKESNEIKNSVSRILGVNND